MDHPRCNPLKGNRIDILIISDEHAILIENKIYAAANNPFEDYADHLDKIAGDCNPQKLLLTPDPTSAGSDWGFRNFTYKEFIEQIRSLLGHYVSNADARYLTMFLDFLNTLENLRKGTRLDKEFVDFLAERSDDIQTFSTHLQHFGTELAEKATSLRSLLDESHPNVIGAGVGGWSILSWGIHHPIKIADDWSVSIRTSISPHGWRIEFSVQRKRDISKLRTLLRQLDIPFEEKEQFVHPARFAYDENLDQIAPVLQELIDKIATSQEHGG